MTSTASSRARLTARIKSCIKYLINRIFSNNLRYNMRIFIHHRMVAMKHEKLENITTIACLALKSNARKLASLARFNTRFIDNSVGAYFLGHSVNETC